jgi:hypothetical protein
MENIFVICLGSIFYVGGPLLLIMGFYYLYLSLRNPKLAEESKNWPTTEGKLTLVHMIGKKGWINNVDVRYDYSVGGEKYTGKNLNLFPNTIFGKENVEEIFEKYHEGQYVTVYTNPNRPKQSIIETDFGVQRNYFLGWSIINILIGVFLVAVLVTGFLGG